MLTITPIPALDSNYFWIIQPDEVSKKVYVVDPGDAAPVIDHLQQQQLQLAGILITHRHHDHTGGINSLIEQWPVPIYGPDSELIPQITHTLKDKDQLQLEGIHFNIIAVPGHTWEHIAYFSDAPNLVSPILFCGDALFAGGCGRRFDGTAEIMWDSLVRLASLPDDTLIYCAHEYTQANLAFAVALEPDNLELRERFEQIKQTRQQGKITLPSSILLEKRTNPFLRCQQAGIKIFTEKMIEDALDTPAKLFGALRSIKDSWPN